MGTDMVAVACILGGAAVAGGVTMALGDEGRHVDSGCSTITFGLTPHVAVSMGGGSETIVVTPSAEIKADCAAVAGVVRTERARERFDRARRRAHRALQRTERARQRAGRARERAERVRVRVLKEQLGPRAVRLQDFQVELEGPDEPLEVALEAQLREELERLMERLERTGDGMGG